MIIRILVVAALLTPAAATAQGNPGPFGGLFGRAERTTADRSVLEMRSSLGAQYDTALLAAEDDAVDSATQSGPTAGATVDLIFEHTSSSLATSLRGGARHYEFFSEPAYGANLFDAAARISPKIGTRLQAEASVAYVHSPYFQFLPDFGQSQHVVVGDSIMTFSPYAVRMLENETVEASTGLTARLTKRSSIDAAVHRRQTQFARQAADDFVLDGYRATWNLGLQQNLRVHAGYGREHAEYRGAERKEFDHEIIDVGVDFNHEFSLARRTTFGFGTSTSIIKDGTNTRRFRLDGDVRFARFFRRTWSAVAQARRETVFMPGFAEPLLSDSVGVSLSGMFTRRVNWTASVNGGSGHYGFSGTKGFRMVSGTSRLTVALGRHLGLFGQYIAYGYRVPKDSTTLDLPDRLSRQAVSVGVDVYLPIYNKTRKP